MHDESTSKSPGIFLKGVAWLAGSGSVLFLANLPGLVPEISDFLPVVGNLDELLASVVLVWSLKTLQISPRRMLQARRERKALAAPEGDGRS